MKGEKDSKGLDTKMLQGILVIDHHGDQCCWQVAKNSNQNKQDISMSTRIKGPGKRFDV